MPFEQLGQKGEAAGSAVLYYGPSGNLDRLGFVNRKEDIYVCANSKHNSDCRHLIIGVLQLEILLMNVLWV